MTNPTLLLLLLVAALLLLLPSSQGTISPLLISSSIGGRSFINTYCSENVEVFNQEPFDSSATVPPRTNCPHLQSGLTAFESAFGVITNNTSYSIAAGQKILLGASAIPADTSIIAYRIWVQNGGVLIFDEADYTLNVREIFVDQEAELWIGSETCRLDANINVVFYGSSTDSSLSGFAATALPSKGLVVWGQADIHGKLYQPTWSRLALSARVNDSLIFLGDQVNWEIGQQVLIVTSAFLDCHDEWAEDYCSGILHQNEVRTITDMLMDPSTGTYALQLDVPLNYIHYAGSEYQTEVALVSRKIKFAGDPMSGTFGGHTAVVFNATGRFSGVQTDTMGQLNILGRYPFHLHLLQSQGSLSYFQDCLVTNSNFRAYVIHGTNFTTVSRCVAYNVTGFAFYLEDGVEENNLLEYNLAVHINPIYKPADGGWGQTGETFTANSNLIVPADTTASGFYISNAYNIFIGNAASGGWSGFAFPNIPFPLGDYKGLDYGNNNPQARPTLAFVGNTAHSSGFYWVGNGNSIYCGANLYYDTTNNGAYTYLSGRNARTTYLTNSSVTGTMYFNHTKVWASNVGFAHWGNEAILVNFEAHDTLRGAMTFGTSAIRDAIINARTDYGSTVPMSRLAWTAKMGFQFYDTWSIAILTRVTFRGYNHSGEKAVRPMDHSDEFLPQGINALRAILYENLTTESTVGLIQCGLDCGEASDSMATMSSRIYNFYDFDGTFSSSGKPSIVGSNRDWWNVGPDCEKQDYMLWRCDWTTNRQIAFLPVTIAGLMDGCDPTVGTCNGQNANYTVGYMSQWGNASLSVLMSPWPGVTGHANIGWYWRPKVAPLGIDGAPSAFYIDNTIQISRGNFVVLAVRYPSAATFNVQLVLWGGSFFNLSMSTKSEVLQNTEPLLDDSQFSNCTLTGVDSTGALTWNQFFICKNTGGVGPAWYFDGNYLYIRVVEVYCYIPYGASSCIGSNAAYIQDGASVWYISNAFQYFVTVTCPGCPIQSTYKGVNFYSVPDVPPPAYDAAPGELRTAETPVYASSKVCLFTPPGSSGSGSGGSGSGSSGSGGSGSGSSGSGSSGSGVSGSSQSSGSKASDFSSLPLFGLLLAFVFSFLKI